MKGWAVAAKVMAVGACESVSAGSTEVLSKNWSVGDQVVRIDQRGRTAKTAA